MNKITTIKYSTKKQVGFIALGVFLMILGSLYFFNITFFKVGYSYLFLIVGAGLAGAVFFNMKQQSGKNALVLDYEKLTYNPEKKLSVPWVAVKGYSEYNLNGSRYILIHLDDPEGFIAKQKDMTIQKNMKRAYKTFDTPVVLNAQFMDISTERLKEEIHRHLNLKQ